MSLDKTSLRRLRKRLPHEYIKAAQAKLSKLGRDLSPSYISQVVTGNRFDQKVIEVLILIADEHQSGIAELKARMVGKHQPA